MSVTLNNSLANPFSVPYAKRSAQPVENISLPTEWVNFTPGIQLVVEDDVWDEIKSHPSVKYFLSEGQISIT